MEPGLARSYEVAFTAKAGYLHAVVTGRNSRDNVLAYLAVVLAECQRRNCRRVLIEERLEGRRLGAPDVYDIASLGVEPALGWFADVAYVDVNASGGLMQFAVDVAANDSLPVRLFSSVSEAERYLLDRAARVQ